MELIFVQQILGRKKLEYQISSKSVQWEPSRFMRAERRTDRQDEAKGRFPHFCERV